MAGRATPTRPVAVDALATTAWTRETVLGNAIARIEPSVDAELWAIRQDAWRQPTPADPDTLDYAAWRDAKQEWRDKEFAWAGRIQQALEAKGMNADWIDVLMCSGGIWQFHCNSHPSAWQPLTKLEPAAIIRMARHCGVDEREMLRAAGVPDVMPIPTLPVQNPPLGQQYADALRQWHNALTTTRQDDSEQYGNLIVFSLRASQFLSQSRTAAYLWAKTFPEWAQRLLADGSYLTVLPTPPAAPDYDVWLKQLRNEAVAARSCEQVAMEWFWVPEGKGCASQAVEHQRKLAALVAGLLPVQMERGGKEQ